MVDKRLSIAIDGPSGAGKSTMAKRIAEQFGLMYIDTGAIYRSVALFAIENGVDSKDQDGVVGLLDEIEIQLLHDEMGSQRMLLCGKDVTDKIRLPEVSICASNVSAMPPVREFLLSMQREFAENCDVVMDGRDIGTVVLPKATIKIFLTAAPEDRARRRYEELCNNGVDTTYDDVLSDIIYRDKNDSERETAPLKPSQDAIIVDTSGNTVEKTTGVLINLIEEKLSNEG